MRRLFALVSAQICDRVDAIRVLESADASAYEAKETQESVGFAHPPGGRHHPKDKVFGYRNSPIKAHQINLQSSLIGSEY